MPTILTPESGLPLVAAGQAGFAALLLATRPDGNVRASRLLAAMFAILALNMCKIAVYAGGVISVFPHLARITFPLELLYGPLFWAFTRVSVGYPLSRRDIMHAAPALLALLALTPFYLESGDTKRAIMLTAQQDRGVQDWLLWLLNWGTLSGYVVATLHTLRRHASRVRDELSSIGPESLRWLHHLTWAMALAQLLEAAFTVTASVRHDPPGSSFLNTFALLAISTTVSVLALRQPALRFHAPVTTAMALPGTEPDGAISPPIQVVQAAVAVASIPLPSDPREDKYARSGLTADEVSSLAVRLESHMRRTEAWRDGTLSLTELARQLQVPPHHLSRALNDVLQQSFFDYVNRLRVAEVQRLLSDASGASRSILDIAFSAGFNSKSSFNASFKQVTGVTPRSYRQHADAGQTTAPHPRTSG